MYSMKTITNSIYSTNVGTPVVAEPPYKYPRSAPYFVGIYKPPRLRRYGTGSFLLMAQPPLPCRNCQASCFTSNESWRLIRNTIPAPQFGIQQDRRYIDGFATCHSMSLGFLSEAPVDRFSLRPDQTPWRATRAQGVDGHDLITSFDYGNTIPKNLADVSNRGRF